MKVFISADIEGVSGTTTWSEASKSSAGYREFQRQMTREVAAACEGALAAGATDILIKDAHGDAGNLVHADLPRQVRLVRGWSGHPFAMVQELDDTFAAVMMVGYHARAGADGNPLAHTLSSRRVHRIFLNDRPASEFYFHYLAAGLVGVPVVMLSGDARICHEVNETDPAILTAAVAHWFADFSVPTAMLLGALLTVSGPTVVLPLLRHVQPVRRIGSLPPTGRGRATGRPAGGRCTCCAPRARG